MAHSSTPMRQREEWVKKSFLLACFEVLGMEARALDKVSKDHRANSSMPSTQRSGETVQQTNAIAIREWGLPLLLFPYVGQWDVYGIGPSWTLNVLICTNSSEVHLEQNQCLDNSKRSLVSLTIHCCLPPPLKEKAKEKKLRRVLHTTESTMWQQGKTMSDRLFTKLNGKSLRGKTCLGKNGKEREHPWAIYILFRYKQQDS